MSMTFNEWFAKFSHGEPIRKHLRNEFASCWRSVQAQHAACEVARMVKSHAMMVEACLNMLETWGSSDEDAIIAARDLARAALEAAGEVPP